MASFTSLVLAINSSFVVNVQDFGAQPVPGLMNTQAFQAAIAAIDANPGGGIIYVPPGTYLTASLNLTSNLVSARHAGALLQNGVFQSSLEWWHPLIGLVFA